MTENVSRSQTRKKLSEGGGKAVWKRLENGGTVIERLLRAGREHEGFIAAIERTC